MSGINQSKAQRDAAGHAALGRFQYLRRMWLTVAIAVLAAVLLLIAPAWRSPGIGLAIGAAGIVLISAAILGRLWCTLYIGGRKSDMVVTTGPYSIMRNPLYFFSCIGAAGAGALSGSITLAVLMCALCAVAFLFVIAREERFLSEKFGAPYAAYLKAVPRLFPKWSLFSDEPVLAVSPSRVYITLMDGLVFYAAVPAIALVKYLQYSGIAPVLLRLY
jgi:protein-S-isoprenylcysteine O-methyltransferase Ste14